MVFPKNIFFGLTNILSYIIVTIPFFLLNGLYIGHGIFLLAYILGTSKSEWYLWPHGASLWHTYAKILTFSLWGLCFWVLFLFWSWSGAQGLGKDGSGMIEPVQAQSTESRAGLGSQQKKVDPSLEVQAGDSYKTLIQKKALARFREMS